MSGRNRFPFTATQWQELEQQALIFKYMVSGFPIPPDLLFALQRSLDSSLSSKLILHQPHQNVGWNCSQMGFGRKIDPEPGRCRRTDGKKWRCSKEAFPDSKYCERHMHRGRNRSRKPVEVMTPPPPPPPPPPRRSSPSKSPPPVPFSPFTTHHHHHSNNTHPHQHSFLYSHSSSSRPPGIDLSSQENTTTVVLDSGPCSNTDKGYRYGFGMKQEVDEHAFFSQSSGSVRSYSGSSMDDPLELTPLTMGGSSLSHLKQRTCSGLQSVYPFLQQTQDQYFHVLGTDIKGEMPLKTEGDEEPQKIMHHFLDECPKNRDSWLDSEGKPSSSVPVSATQLSISTPNSSYDFFMANNDK